MSLASLTARKKLEPSSKVWKPWEYQKIAMKFQLENAVSGLLLDPGMGKTSISLGSVTELMGASMFERALVIAPRRVCHDVWPVEVQEWTQFNHLRVSVLHQTTPKKRLAALETDADLYVINPEGLSWLLSDRGLFNALGPCTLIVDESSKFKDAQTQRFKLLKPYLNRFSRRWILTGSPMSNGYINLFGQMYILDLGNALGQFITHYRTRYFYPTGYGGYTWKLKPEMAVDKRTWLPADEGTLGKFQLTTTGEKAIQERVKPLALRFDAESYLKMPQLIGKEPPHLIRVTLPDDCRKLYDEMEEEMMVVLKDGTDVLARSAAAASQKCAQIANGGLYFTKFDDELIALRRGFHQLHDVKTEALEDLVEEASGVPVMCAYEFQHDLARLQKAFPKAPVLGGGTSDKAASAIIRGWNAREYELILVHPATMGHGLNLQKGGNHIVFYGIPWDYEHYDQLIRRVWRQGCSFNKVFVHHIVTTDTVDEAKMRALTNKAKNQNSFMAALKEYAELRRVYKQLRTKLVASGVHVPDKYYKV